jgi:hypothetical protein
MRLINVHTQGLKEFFGAELPHYAILSHRWEKEEVTFQDLTSGKGKDMIGWKKILGCCELAIDDKLDWAWIDSCCIDKTSSAELSEAINSMFRWYRDAEICYAYLSDVSGPLERANNMDAFRFSKWFTRGWTLQELLAPDELTFFDKDWQEIGTKEGLRDAISRVTGIKHLFNFEDASVAQKMSWAAKRETTRLEDQAYCLLGIFGVNMPLLYGEGRSAFLRLQLEIMRISNDESLFAWEDESVTSGGLLAPSPMSFRYSYDIISLPSPRIERPPYTMTNKGLEISLHLVEHDTLIYRAGQFDISPRDQLWAAPLNCAREETILSVLLRKEDTGTENYQRVQCFTLPSHSHDAGPHSSNSPGTAAQIIYIKQPQVYSGTRSYCYFRINPKPLCSAGWMIKVRHLSNSELGRWGTDVAECLHLKLSNSTATVQFNHELQDGSSDMCILKLSCLDKKAKVDLFTARGFSPKAVSLATTLQYFKTMPTQSQEIVPYETRTLRRRSFQSEGPLRVSLWKEGGSGSRDIFALELNTR